MISSQWTKNGLARWFGKKCLTFPFRGNITERIEKGKSIENESPDFHCLREDFSSNDIHLRSVVEWKLFIADVVAK